MLVRPRRVHFRSSQIESLETRCLMAADVAGSYAEFATLVTDANTARVNANANWSVPFNGSNYFLVSSEGGYNELWKTDGTAQGTELVTQVSRHPFDNEDNGCTCFGQPLVIGDQLYFVVMTGRRPLIRDWIGTATTQLWQTDGTAEGTSKVRELAVEEAWMYGSFNQRFDLFDDYGSIGVIAHGGDEEVPYSTFLDYDFAGVTHPGLHLLHLASLDMVQRDNATYFLGFALQTDSWGFLAGASLYKANAATKTIAHVADLKDSRRWSHSSLTELDEQLVITGREGKLVYHSDGTPEGTALVQDAENTSNGTPVFGPGFRSRKRVFTLGSTPDGQTIQYSRNEMKVDGEVVFAYPVNNQGSQPHSLIVASDGDNNIGIAYANIVSRGSRPKFYLTNGTDEGTNEITVAEYRTFLSRATSEESPDQNVVNRARTFGEFSSGNFWGVTNSELTSATFLQSVGQEFAVWENKTFFNVETEEGVQVWSTDGTDEGTELALDLGATETLPMSLTVWDDKLFFAADDIIHGNELWVIDLAAHAAAQGRQRADINDDGFVDFADFLVLSANFGNETEDGKAAGDLDSNQVVDFIDFLLLSDAYGLG